MHGITRTYVRFVITVAILATAALGLPASTAIAEHGGAHATADLIDAEGGPIGTVHFEDLDDGSSEGGEQVVAILVEIDPGSGLSPGFHGFHVHADDDPSNGAGCTVGLTNGFASVDGHYNGGSHGDHAGDLPVVYVEEDGSSTAVFLTDRFTIAEVLDRAVIVHAQPDNFANIPDRYETDEGTGPDSATESSGDAGDRAACGDIEDRQADVSEMQGGDDLGALLTTDTGEPIGISFFGDLDDGSGFVAGTFMLDNVGGAGFHGHHVHGGNRCQFEAGNFDFSYAQSHLTADGGDHPDHSGDLPVLLMPETTTAQSNFFGAVGASTTDRLSADAVKGRTVIVHGAPDNYANIPDRYRQADGDGGVPDAITLAGGDSGDRVACGMIEGLVRLAGFDRMDTAVSISRDSFLADDSAEAAVLARADRFPDALAGTSLAEAKGGPILLTPSGDLDDDTATELQRVLPDGATVYLLGGSAALDPDVEDAVEDLGFVTERLAGATRFETAVEIADELDASHDTIFITTGLRWPDAVSAGAAAAHHDAVILFSGGDNPHGTTDAYLADHQDENLFAIGGPAARAYPDATGVFGVDRNATSVAVAEEFSPDGTTYVGLARDGASGTDEDNRFADALTGGVHVGRLGGAMLLVHEEQLPDVVRDHLQDNAGAVVREYAYGGNVAISPETATAAERAANEAEQTTFEGAARAPLRAGLLGRLLR